MWRKVRIAFYLLTAVLSAASESVADEVEWWSVPLVLLFSVVSVVILVGIQAVNPLSAREWRPPSWDATPFDLGQPLQVVHFGGWWFVVGGCGMLASSVLHASGNWGSTGIVLAAGIGLLFGVRLCERVFTSKVQSASSRVRRGGPTRS